MGLQLITCFRILLLLPQLIRCDDTNRGDSTGIELNFIAIVLPIVILVAFILCCVCICRLCCVAFQSSKTVINTSNYTVLSPPVVQQNNVHAGISQQRQADASNAGFVNPLSNAAHPEIVTTESSAQKPSLYVISTGKQI